ncbi:cuticle protein AM1274-like [Oratosquilla oratoria]|uniref:cuticle protein AM1274-like n=1 Tax=Oratosquilla oratoria TaxID=337810 RepID=UPI003F75906F
MTLKIVLLSACLCVASAQQFFSSQQEVHHQFMNEPNFVERPRVEILKAESSGPGPDGSYAFSYEDSAGGSRKEVSQATGPNSFAVQGAYTYVNDEGSIMEVRYVADESGFHVESPSVPQPHPTPLHAIEQLQIAEEQKRQGLVFDNRGFLIDHHSSNQVAFNQEISNSRSVNQGRF